MNPKLKMQKTVERLLTKEGFKFVRVDGVGWKIPDGNISYSWLEYQGSAHEDKILLSVDKLRDDAENFRHLVEKFHNRVVVY